MEKSPTALKSSRFKVNEGYVPRPLIKSPPFFTRCKGANGSGATVPKSSINRWHRLSSLCRESRLVVHSLERLCHPPIPDFSCFTDEPKAHEELLYPESISRDLALRKQTDTYSSEVLHLPLQKTENRKQSLPSRGGLLVGAFVPGADDLLAFFHEPGVLALGAGPVNRLLFQSELALRRINAGVDMRSPIRAL